MALLYGKAGVAEFTDECVRRAEVISLRHRTAEQVIPVLRPLLEPGGALSGQYNQLIGNRAIWVKVEELR